MERRLAAILTADVVGYSRLMGKDKATTLAALKAHSAELIDPKIAEHHGRIVKLMGVVCWRSPPTISGGRNGLAVDMALRFKCVIAAK